MSAHDDLSFDKLSEVMASFHRRQLRVIETPQQEAAREIGEAIARGCQVVINPYIEPNAVVLVDGCLHFHSEGERDAFIEKINAARKQTRARKT